MIYKAFVNGAMYEVGLFYGEGKDKEIIDSIKIADENSHYDYIIINFRSGHYKFFGGTPYVLWGS